MLEIDNYVENQLPMRHKHEVELCYFCIQLVEKNIQQILLQMGKTCIPTHPRDHHQWDYDTGECGYDLNIPGQAQAFWNVLRTFLTTKKNPKWQGNRQTFYKFEDYANQKKIQMWQKGTKKGKKEKKIKKQRYRVSIEQIKDIWMIPNVSKEERKKLFKEWTEQKRGYEKKASCPICLNSISKSQKQILKCSHIFHKECFNDWKSDCPICRCKT